MIDLTWPQGKPMRVLNPQVVRYVKTVKRKGKLVPTETAYTVASMRPATAEEIEIWKNSPARA